MATSPERLREFATTLRRSDRVALEATMNTAAIAGLLGERAGEVVVSNPFKTRVIGEAKIKTLTVDLDSAASGPRASARVASTAENQTTGNGGGRAWVGLPRFGGHPPSGG
ncbi:MAG: hypothetical protein ACYC1D_13295 [Acidimicrobiales bacterium]